MDYIGKTIDDIPEDMKEESATPAVNYLFDIVEDTTKLYQSDKDLFHHFESQILYLSRRARLDIHLPVSLLCTIVIGTENDDYRKMARMINYI